MKKRVYLVDIDGTICDDIKNEESHLYPEAKVYDGALDELNNLSAPGSTLTPYDGAQINIGKASSGGNNGFYYFEGKLNQIMIFDRVLDACER